MAFSQETADLICQRLADGLSLRKACPEGMSPSTVLRWLEASTDFAEQYTRARDIGYKLLADELIEIADDASGDTVVTESGPKQNPEFAARSRLRLDTRKWMLSKMLPKVYGDKLELGGEVTHKIQKLERVLVDATGSVPGQKTRA